MVYLHQIIDDDLHITSIFYQTCPRIIVCVAPLSFISSLLFRSQTRLATSTLAPLGAAGARGFPRSGGRCPRTAARAAARIAEATEDGKFRRGSGLKGLKEPGFSLDLGGLW